MSNITIHRCPHDRKNPYVMISRDLIRDKNLSPECRWLLVYLLSNEEEWSISVRQLREHLEGVCGKAKIYTILKEAVEKGYMLLEKFKEGNLNRCRYLVSETPKFKKCFRHPDFRDAESRDPGETDSRSLYIKKEHIEEYIPPISPPLPEAVPKKVPDKPSPEARMIGEYLKTKILEVNPHFSESTAKWDKVCEELLRKKSVNHLKSLIYWTFNNDFWKTIIVSPKYLKKNISKIEAKMEQEKCQKNNQTQKMKNYAREMNNYPEERSHSNPNISESDMQKLRLEFPEVFGNLKKLPNS